MLLNKTNSTRDAAALRYFDTAHVSCGVKLGPEAMSGSMSGLPKSGHDWAIL